MGAQSKQFPFHPSHQINLSPLYWFRKSPSLWIFFSGLHNIEQHWEETPGPRKSEVLQTDIVRLIFARMLCGWIYVDAALLNRTMHIAYILESMPSKLCSIHFDKCIYDIWYITPLSKLSPAWKQKVVINGVLGSIIMLPNSRMQMKAAKKSRIWIWKDFPEFLTKVAAVSVGFN